MSLVLIILGVVCSGIYFFSKEARVNAIKRRLTNRAITTARLLAQKEIFDQKVVQRIDSLTTMSLANKTVQAYDFHNKTIYSYSDKPGDTLHIDNEILGDARANGSRFFKVGKKEAVAYSYTDNNPGLVVVSAAEDVDGKQNMETLENVLLFSFLLGNALVLIIGYVFSTRLLLPIKKIAADVEEISAQSLTRRIKTGKTKDEWYQLANTLNQLLNRLQESFELQRRFISNASHELSTPLTSILSQMEVAFQRDREAGEYKNVMQSIYQDVRNLSKLIKTLLEFAKASGNSGGLEINLLRIDELILRLPSEISRVKHEYTVVLEFDNPPEDEEMLLAFGNEELLLTAFKNIVINACKYSGDHRAIIKLQTIDRRIIVNISDHGIGISKNDVNNIFHPFYRANENLETEGFGLGLSLADRIIKLHKGNIEVNSEINVGTNFMITLPSAGLLT
jgi:signal transduction histidine kinase